MGLREDFEKNIEDYNNRSIPKVCELLKLDFSTRVFNVLIRNGIDTIEVLVKTPLTDIRDYRNVGLKSITEIIDKTLEYLNKEKL